MDVHEKKVALLPGATGRNGAYLLERLLSKDCVVHGLKGRSSSFNTGRTDHLYQDPREPGQGFVLHDGDMTDSTNLIRIVQRARPDERGCEPLSPTPLRKRTFGLPGRAVLTNGFAIR